MCFGGDVSIYTPLGTKLWFITLAWAGCGWSQLPSHSSGKPTREPLRTLVSGRLPAPACPLRRAGPVSRAVGCVPPHPPGWGTFELLPYTSVVGTCEHLVSQAWRSREPNSASPSSVRSPGAGSSSHRSWLPWEKTNSHPPTLIRLILLCVGPVSTALIRLWQWYVRSVFLKSKIFQVIYLTCRAAFSSTKDVEVDHDSHLPRCRGFR